MAGYSIKPPRFTSTLADPLIWNPDGTLAAGQTGTYSQAAKATLPGQVAGSPTDPGAPPKTPTAPLDFNLSPTPQQGTNPFGYIPGQLGLPSPAKDLAAQIPGLGGLNQQMSSTIASYLGGELPTDVQDAIQDAAAKYGVTSGMPGSGLVRSRTARDLGLTSLDLQGRGLAAYGPFVGAVSSTQVLNPALQAQIAEQNALNAAAPDPTMAAMYQKQLYDQYLAAMAQSGGRVGPQGGSRGGYNPFSAFTPTSYTSLNPPRSGTAFPSLANKPAYSLPGYGESWSSSPTIPGYQDYGPTLEQLYTDYGPSSSQLYQDYGPTPDQGGFSLDPIFDPFFGVDEFGSTWDEYLGAGG